jgi:hypothetical protein
MSSEQVKGTLLAVGATAASTMLLVGGFVTIHNSYENAASVDPSTVIDVRAKQASDAAAGGTGEFSDHCLVMREGYMVAVPSASWTTDEQGNPVMDSLPGTLDWQWVNTTRQSPGWSTFLDPLTVGNTYPKVATPDGRTQDNLNEWFDVIKKHVPGSYPVPGMLQVGYKADSRPQHVLAAHCEWDIKISSSAQEDDDSGTLSDVVSLASNHFSDSVDSITEDGDNLSWLTVDGKKAHVTAHGRAYYTVNKPVAGNDIPADARLIGETTLNFDGSTISEYSDHETKTATINKPSDLDGGYVTWVWTVDKNDQSGDWGKYLTKDTVSDGWATETEIIQLPKAPKKPKPNATPTPSVVTPSPEPSVTTPAPTPSESSTLSPAPVESGTPTTPTQVNTPSINSVKTPETRTNLAHTGSMAAPIIEASVLMLAAGLTIALKKRNNL